MKKTIILLSLTLIFIAQGCYTTQSVSNKDQETQSVSNKDQEFENMMNSWKGSTKNALLLEWGSPANVTSDGNGGEILTFEELKRAYFESMGYITVIHKYMFYVNKDNIIYYWRYERSGRQGH